MEGDRYVRLKKISIEMLYNVLSFLKETEAWIGQMSYEWDRDIADVRTLPSNLCHLRFANYASGSPLQNRAFSMIRSAADSELCLGQNILWYV